MWDKTPSQLWPVPVRRGTFGLELEMEGRDLPLLRLHPHWKVTEEGSLRNGGVEYVTKSPIREQNISPYINELYDLIKAEGGRIVPRAYRASTHIHYNCTAVPFVEILGIITVYTALEPLFLALCGEHRNGNLFCASSYDCGDLHQFLATALPNLVTHNMWMERGKYAALNTDPLTRLGSIEFRGFPSIDPALKGEDVLLWTSWVKKIHEMVQAQEDKSCLTLLEAVAAGPTPLQNILGLSSADLNKKLHPHDPDELVRIGLENAYECARLIARALKKDKGRKAS